MAGQVIRGFNTYFAVPTNSAALTAFRDKVTIAWMAMLTRRSQRHRLTWPRMKGLADRYLQSRTSCIRGRTLASASDTQDRSRMLKSGTSGSVRGAVSNDRPYRDADLFGLSLPSTGIEQSSLAHPMDQARQTEDHRHPVVRVRCIKLGADHLAGEPPMGGSGLEPPHHHGVDPLAGAGRPSKPGSGG